MFSPPTVPHRPVVVRAGQAEYLPSIGHTLLADSSATGGALSTHRITLGRGADGAVPHRHDASSELFFVLDGVLDVLVGDEVVSANAGDLLVVPPGLVHAFAAHQCSGADALIVVTPGIERFDYFRHVVRLRQATETKETLRQMQALFDTYFLDSAVWAHARAVD